MKFASWLAPAVIACAIIGGASTEAATCTSAQYGSFTIGSYSFNNDIWGSGAGPQTICANNANSFYITSTQPNSGGVKAYGDVHYNVGKALSSINTLTSTFTQTTPSAGTWDVAYDIWNTSNSYEIMLWTKYQNTGPVSYNYNAQGNAVPVYTNVNVGGATWNVYEGNNGHDVISFLRTSKTNSATVDVRAILLWIESKGYFGNITVGQVEYGVEVTTTSGAETFNFSNYSVTSK